MQYRESSNDLEFLIVFVATFIISILCLWWGNHRLRQIDFLPRWAGGVAAVICLLSLAYLSSFIGMVVFSLPIMDFFMGPLIWPIILFIWIWLGISFGRYFVRLVPPYLTGTVRTGVLIAMTCVIAVIFLTQISKGLLPESLQYWMMRPIFFGAPLEILGYLNWLTGPVFWGSIALTVIIYHARPVAALDQPFVLFLRRFSSFADRSVVAAVLAKSSAHRPVAFLTPERSRVGDWNPFLICFAGFKLTRPWRPPLLYRGQEDSWQDHVNTLVARADKIVIDLTDTSAAMEAEADMIGRAGRWEDTIVLVEQETNLSEQAEREGADVISYRRSWFRALPRLLLGIVAVYGFYNMYTRLLYHIPGTASADGFLDLMTSSWISGVTVLVFVQLTVLFVCWNYLVLFGRPSLDTCSSRALRRSLRAPSARATHASEQLVQEASN